MNPDQYARLCAVLGDDELATDPKFATNESRLVHHDELRARIEAALARATTAEWVRRFEAAQVAAGPIYEFDRSEEHTSELQSRLHLVCRLLLEKKKTNTNTKTSVSR